MTDDAKDWVVTVKISHIKDVIVGMDLNDALGDKFDRLPESEGIQSYWTGLPMDADTPKRAIRAEFGFFDSEEEAKAFEKFYVSVLRETPEVFGLGISSHCHLEGEEQDDTFPPRPALGAHMRVTIEYGHANISVRCDGHLIRNFCGIEVPRQEAIDRAEAYADGFRKALEFCAD